MTGKYKKGVIAALFFALLGGVFHVVNSLHAFSNPWATYYAPKRAGTVRISGATIAASNQACRMSRLT